MARVPTPLCGPWTQTSLPAHRSWAAGLRGSDGEGDEAVVALDVPLEDLGAGAQHALKAGPVQLDTLEGPSGHHGGRPGPVQQQRDLPWGARGWSGARPTGLPALLSSTGFQQARPGEHRHTVSHPSAATPTPQGLGELGVRGHALPGAAASRTHPSRAPQPAPRIPPMALHLSALPGTPPTMRLTPCEGGDSRLTEVVGRPQAPHLHVLLIGGPALEDGGRALQTPRGYVRISGWSGHGRGRGGWPEVTQGGGVITPSRRS